MCIKLFESLNEIKIEIEGRLHWINFYDDDCIYWHVPFSYRVSFETLQLRERSFMSLEIIYEIYSLTFSLMILRNIIELLFYSWNFQKEDCCIGLRLLKFSDFSYTPKALSLSLKPGFNTNCQSPHSWMTAFSCNKLNLCFDQLPLVRFW